MPGRPHPSPSPHPILRRGPIRALLGWLALAIAVSGSVPWAQVNAETVADHAVPLSATVQRTPPGIRLTWTAAVGATGYQVARRDDAGNAWQPLATLARNAAEYLDLSITPGAIREYRVTKTTATYTAQGFITATFDTPLVEDRGVILLVIDQTFSTTLADALAVLEQDLVGDGWQVRRLEVARTARPANVRQLIASAHAAEPSRVRAVYLFGHVPVPYSGDLAPDGHPDHQGAWPADVFYGDIDGTWPDASVNTTSAADPRNRNIPGDGKFDPSTLPNDVELEVGRVDLANLPAFSESEAVLLRRYLQKAHAHRHRATVAAARGLVDDNFGILEGNAYGADAWGNFGSLLGSRNVVPEKWINTLPTQSRLWAYGSGGGAYTLASGVIDTSSMASGSWNAVFTMIFGSYFGDWDHANALLRTPLAASGLGLSAIWSGLPSCYFHPMGAGATLGSCTRLSQNNRDTYPTYWGPRSIHIALMGDPALRMHVVAPPSGLTIQQSDDHTATLDWNAPAQAVGGYHVYRKTAAASRFTRINPALVTSRQYIDTASSIGATYMVRAVALQTSNGGTYWNASQGIFGESSSPSVALTISSPTASALGQHRGEVTFTRTAPLGAPLTIRYALSGTATNGVDYATLGSELQFPTGVSTVTLPISALPRTGAVPEKRLTITAVPGLGYKLARPSSGTVRIAATSQLYLPYGGSYHGLIAAVSPAGDFQGELRILLGSTGAFSGFLNLQGRAHRFTGVLGSDGKLSLDLPGTTFQLALTMDFLASPRTILGTLSDGAAVIGTILTTSGAPASHSAIAGRYTVGILPTPDPDSPAGAGWGFLTIGNTGAVRLSAALADGSPLSVGANIAAPRRWWLYAPLQRGLGWIGGEVTFQDIAGSSDAAGVLTWHRHAVSGSTIYPGGFDTNPSFVACRFLPAARGVRPLDYQNAIGNAIWRASAGNLSSPLQSILTLDPTATWSLAPAAPGAPRLSVSAATGLMAGAFVHPGSGRGTRFGGVTLGKRQTAMGHFLDAGRSGLVTIAQNPAFSGSAPHPPANATAVPRVAIAAPLPGTRVNEIIGAPAIATVNGIATGSAPITSVQYQVLRGGNVSALQTASGTAAWSFGVQAPAAAGGLYTVFVKATDAAGNQSPLVARSFTYVAMRPLTVQIEPAGAGIVSAGFEGVTSREVGKTYAIAAYPRAGYRFVGWTGSGTATTASLRFTMTEGMQWKAIFAPR